jgi:hypothetical protein
MSRNWRTQDRAAPTRKRKPPVAPVSNWDQVSRITALALKRRKSVDFTGYWQRHIQE